MVGEPVRRDRETRFESDRWKKEAREGGNSLVQEEAVVVRAVLRLDLMGSDGGGNGESFVCQSRRLQNVNSQTARRP